MRIIAYILAILITLGIVSGCKVKETVVVEVEDAKAIKYSEHTLVDFVIENELSVVLGMAKDESKLTFVEFYTDWCLPCQIMDESVFMNKPLSAYYNESFVSFKLNGDSDEGRKFGFVFEVSQYPTFVVLDERGRVVAKEIGGKGVTEMMLFGENAIKEYANWENAESGE